MLVARLSIMRDGDSVLAVATPRGCFDDRDHQFQLLDRRPLNDEELFQYGVTRAADTQDAQGQSRSPLFRFRCLECGLETLQALRKITGVIAPRSKLRSQRS